MPSKYNYYPEESYNDYSEEVERVAKPPYKPEPPCKPGPPCKPEKPCRPEPPWKPEKPCRPEPPHKPGPPWEDHDKEKLFAKVFCICDCDDLQHLINCFLKEEVDQKHHCIKPEFMVSLGCKCPCGQETVVLFYRKTDNPCHMKDWN